MSKKNYTNYNNMSVNAEPVVEPVVEETVVEPAIMVEEPVAEVEPEVIVEPVPVYGYVDKCEKLNVRKSPTKHADAVCVIPAKTEVMIDTDKSTNDWYSVRTAAGVEGFCMKNFITIK